MSEALVRAFDPPKNENVPDLLPGDSVTVYVRVVEGRRERVQMIRGVVIRIMGKGVTQRFTVRRVASNGIGVELTYLASSPLIEKLEIHRRAHVRRSKLYYLRGRTGKSARLKEKRTFA
ncbi:MAG: 50S ribosomal protein L19 [Chloroflexota bacterium]